MRRTKRLVAGLFSLLLALSPGALGKAPSSAGTHRGAFSLVVPAGTQRAGMRADFEPSGRTLTVRLDGKSDVLGHVIQLPPLPTGAVRSELVRLAGGEHALVLRFGEPEPYVLVLLPPPVDSSATLDGVVVLKGVLSAASGSAASLSVVDASDGQRLLLSEPGAGSGGLCGRQAHQIRALDARRGRFVRVGVPVLGADERRKASKVSARAVLAAEAGGRREIYLGPWPSAFEIPELDAPALTDGRLNERPSPYEVVDLSLAPGAGVQALVVRVGEGAPPGASWDLWLLTEQAAFEVDTSKVRESKEFIVDLPKSWQGGCLGLTVGVGAPFVEVTGHLPLDSAPPPPGSVSPEDALEAADGDLAARQLALVRPSVLPALGHAYGSLLPAARNRAEALARLAEPNDAEGFWVRQAIDGSEGERTRGRARLASQTDGGVGALGRALRSARARDELPLAQALAELSPAAAVRPIAGRLGQRSAARRLELRKVLAGLAAEPAFLEEAGRFLLDDQAARAERIEVVRALTPVLTRLGSKAREAVLQLFETASFDEAYVLAPAALELTVAAPAAQKIVLAWLVGQGLAPPELAALRTEILVAARDRELRASWLAEQSMELLTDPFVRVRTGAAGYLELAPLPRASRALIQGLESDDWPMVREATLGALAALRDDPELAEGVEQAMIRALAKDAVPSVRGRAARALDRLPRSTTSAALRRSLDKDDSALVRAEAARALGLVCDHEATEGLTRAARGLTRGVRDEVDVRLGLNAVTALARLGPADLDERLAPLTAKSVPGPLRGRVEGAIATGRGGCATAKQR